jgi:asparagine synthetase B (glutamine-hydrolysing)
MCGLHGIVTAKRETYADNFIEDAFVANMLRGVDSSGIASVDLDTAEFDFHKLPVSGVYFAEDKVATRLIKNACIQNTLTMCHVRAATVGKVNVSNAHPFCYEEGEGTDYRVVIGAHNGTLTGWTTNTSSKGYTVDSEWAIHHIAQEGFDAFEDFKGAYCFVWWDSDKRDTLNIARNTERPMFVAMLETGGMAYASEAGMLYWLLERRGIKMSGPIMELQAGFWYKFNIQDVKDFDKIKLPSPTQSYATQTHVPRTAYASEVDKVTALLAKVKKQEESAAATSMVPEVTQTTPKQHEVTTTEYNQAKNYKMLGMDAVFTPYSEWEDGVEGLAMIGDMELAASVRGMEAMFEEGEEWECKVIGVAEDGDELVAILSHPAKRNTKEAVH